MKSHHSAWPAEPGHVTFPQLLCSHLLPLFPALSTLQKQDAFGDAATQWSSKCGPQSAVPGSAASALAAKLEMQGLGSHTELPNQKPWVRAPAICVFTSPIVILMPAEVWNHCSPSSSSLLPQDLCSDRTPCLACSSQSSSSIIQTSGEISALERELPRPSYLKWASLFLLIPVYTIILLISP